MMFAFFAGLAAGLLHVFTGPDHLAAVTPLVVDNGQLPPPGEGAAGEARRGPAEGWRTGLQWGVGHTAGVVLIAALLLLLSEQLPLDAISSYSERLVGVALIAVGVWGIRKASRPSRPHTHAGASFAMGTLHGLAGSSHLFGILPALAFSLQSDAVLYLAGFGIGGILGMSVFAAAVGVVSFRLGHNHPGRYRGLLYASSAAALVIGGFWLVA
jgi:hypothetical protein